jgi:sugar phosphate isomerase/epimerase
VHHHSAGAEADRGLAGAFQLRPRLAAHYGMPVLAVHAPTLLITQRVWGREPWPKLERSCEAAVRLGAGTVVVHPPFRWQREYAAGFVDGVQVLAERHGVRLAVENMYPWRAGGREMLAYHPGWDPVPQPFGEVTLDLSHTATAGSDALAMARELGGRLHHLHLADGSGSARDEHLVPGRGTQPCAEVLGLLAERGWTGTVVVEVNTRRCRNQDEREADVEQSLAFARLHLAAPALRAAAAPAARTPAARSWPRPARSSPAAATTAPRCAGSLVPPGWIPGWCTTTSTARTTCSSPRWSSRSGRGTWYRRSWGPARTASGSGWCGSSSPSGTRSPAATG